MPYFTPDGEYEMEPFINGTTKIRAVDGSLDVNVDTQGRMPTANPTGNLLLWAISDNQTIPGQARPQTHIYLSQINGEHTREVFALAGADARWMNDENILVSVRDEQRQTMLYVYRLTDERFIELGQWREMRGLSVSPGGRYGDVLHLVAG